MRSLEARTGGTADEMARLKKQAYDVGSELPRNTADIIRAQEAFFSLGYTIDQTLAAMPDIANYSVAAGVEIELAATHASVALNNFDIPAANVAVVLDQILKAQTLTAASAYGLGESFQYSAAQAAAAGVQTEEYISILGFTAGAGRDVEAVSQGIGLMLTNIARGTSESGRGAKLAQDAFAALGITMDEVRGSMTQGERGFTHLLELMARKSEELSPDILQASLAALAGTSYASAVGYVIQNVEGLGETTDQVFDSVGEGIRQALNHNERSLGCVEIGEGAA